MLNKQLGLFFIFGFSSFLTNAQQAPLACDGTAYLLGAADVNSPSVISLADGETGSQLSLPDINPDVQANFNSLAYNADNDLLYASVNYPLVSGAIEGNLVTIDADGIVTDLGQPTPNGTTFVNNWNYAVNGSLPAWAPRVILHAGTIQDGIYYFFAHQKRPLPYRTFLVKVDLATFTYTDIQLSLGLQATDMAFSEDTGLLYSLFNGTLFSTNPNTGEQVVLSTVGSVDAPGAWSDDTGGILFYDAPNAEVYRYDIAGNTISGPVTDVQYLQFDATACFSAKTIDTAVKKIPSTNIWGVLGLTLSFLMIVFFIQHYKKAHKNL